MAKIEIVEDFARKLEMVLALEFAKIIQVNKLEIEQPRIWCFLPDKAREYWRNKARVLLGSVDITPEVNLFQLIQKEAGHENKTNF